MSSLAAVHTVQRNASRMRGTDVRHRARKAVRPRTRFWRNVRFVCLAVFLGAAFAYASLYANLTAASYGRSRLSNDFRAEKIKNERLWVEYVRRSSPDGAIAVARSSNMVYAADYDYLYKSNTVAKAPEDR